MTRTNEKTQEALSRLEAELAKIEGKIANMQPEIEAAEATLDDVLAATGRNGNTPELPRKAQAALDDVLLRRKAYEAARRVVELDIESTKHALRRQEIDGLKAQIAEYQKRAGAQAERLERAMVEYDTALAEAHENWQQARVTVQKLGELTNPTNDFHRGNVLALAVIKGLWRDPLEAVELRRRVLAGRLDGLLPGYQPKSMKEAFFGSRLDAGDAAKHVIEGAK